jgi:hypothetical protein
MTNGVPPVRDHRGDGTIAVVPACPYCAKPRAVVARLVPSAAVRAATTHRYSE